MKVSRETSLSDLLSLIRKNLGLDSNSINAYQGFSGLTYSAANLILLALSELSDRPLLVSFDSDSLAEKLYFGCFNLYSDHTVYFPGLPLNEINVSGFNIENERYRSESVNLLRKKSRGLVFATDMALNVPSINIIPEKEISFKLKINTIQDRQAILNALIRWDYVQTDHTETPKTFSARGGILDVFLPYAVNPLRIEFFGNKIDSIRFFNPRSQRTIKNVDLVEILPPPSKAVSNIEKISLLNCFKKNVHIVHVSENSGALKIIFNNDSNELINLNCQDVALNGARDNDTFELPNNLKTYCPNNLFLFSVNNKSQKSIEKLIPNDIKIIRNTLEKGFYSKELNLCCISSTEINNQSPILKSRWTVDSVAEIPQKEFSSLEDLDWGDYLVHQDFGIGVYRGLEIIKTHHSVNQECIKIEYANQANIFVPIDNFNRVHRMIVAGEKTPVLSTLNAPRWKRQKQNVKDSAKKVVQDLVKLYTSRNQKRGFKYNDNNSFSRELELSFPYDETPGQKSAIEAINSDMEQDFSVDRLICGDVGFGKTEVALRAALKAIISGKKVLFLTPTTILADQHYISTKGRFEPLGINIELLSRFKTKKQQQEILEKMLTGSVDIVIGTHRLLSEDVKFPDLGLLIIDEEHRFGVKHKEKLRHLRAAVDVITLTATPIPRTLQQSLLGIRDVSRISTPPKTRRPIKTFVQYFDWNNIQAVVNNEFMRGGQIYYLHNDISSIPFILKKLITLFPNNTIGVAHGRMNAKNLENTVLAFFAGEIDLLLCTTIIESGLDVANANTIIINNAQNFGLAQLYQIRGRVGRSYQQAYCYLLLPRGKTISDGARRRLKAIEQFTSLGSGYDISLKDLEIRGAGNLFGYKQSGNMAVVGFEMYCKLLQEALDESLGNADSRLEPPKISIPINAILEDDYVQLVQDRLHFYQQLSEASTIESINEIESELQDRFGVLPKSAKNLIYITNIRIKFTGTAVYNISIIGSQLKLQLKDFAPFSSAQELINNISEKMTLNSLNYQFSPSKDGFTISVFANDLNGSLKALELFVGMFSK